MLDTDHRIRAETCFDLCVAEADELLSLLLGFSVASWNDDPDGGWRKAHQVNADVR